MSLEIVCDRFIFPGNCVVPAVGSPDGQPWRKSLTNNATVANAGGYATLTLTNANEAQNAPLYFGDELTYDIDDLIAVEFWATLQASLASTVKARLGLASARNADPDSIAQSIFFGVNGSGSANALHCESDDGTNETAATATGLGFAADRLYKFVIDFTAGVVSGSPSVGGKYDVHMLATNARGQLRRVCDQTRFNMGAYTGKLQPFFQIQKTAATDTGVLKLAELRVRRRQSAA